MKNLIFIIACLLAVKVNGQNLIVEYLAEHKLAEQQYSVYLVDDVDGTYDINIFHTKFSDYSELLKDSDFLKSRIYINSLKKEDGVIYGARYHNKGKKVYKDTPPPIDWKISNETKTILGFPCKKATATFRGRKYTAWYTEDIAVSQGPWKLRGLPGLILAAKGGGGGIANSRALGIAGEQAVGLSGAKTAIQVGGRTKIPDALTRTTLTEVKNVKSLSFTRQLRDFHTYSQQNGLDFILYTRPNTTLSGPLQQAINNGSIIHRFIP